MTLKTRLLIDYYVGGLAHFTLKPLVMALGWLLHRNHRLSDVKDVVIVKLMGGGSLVIAYPALLAIKRLPQVKSLRLVASPTTKPFAELLRRDGYRVDGLRQFVGPGDPFLQEIRPAGRAGFQQRQRIGGSCELAQDNYPDVRPILAQP